MDREIRVGKLLLAGACGKCDGVGSTSTMREAEGLTGVYTVRCEACEGIGYLLTVNGKNLAKFIKLLLVEESKYE